MTAEKAIAVMLQKLTEIAERDSWENSRHKPVAPFDGSDRWMRGYDTAALTRSKRAKEGLAAWREFQSLDKPKG